MAQSSRDAMALPPEKLNELDEWILEFLSDHEWATVNLMLAFYNEEDEVSRQWLATRVSRLTEHEHLEKVKDTSTYRLVDDPRDAK